MGNLAAVIIRMSQRDLHVRLHVTKVKITLLLANSFTYEVISKVLYLRTKTMSSYHHDFISTIIVPLSLSHSARSKRASSFTSTENFSTGPERIQVEKVKQAV